MVASDRWVEKGSFRSRNSLFYFVHNLSLTLKTALLFYRGERICNLCMEVYGMGRSWKILKLV